MTSHNVSVYLDNIETWKKFKVACKEEGKRPNTVLRSFIESYCSEIFEIEIPLEKQIAQGMIEAKRIAKGKIKGKDARKLLAEIG